MNELVIQNEKMMTTKELAEVLGVDVKTIQRTVDSLDITVERIGSSHTMVFDEAQATMIKQEIQKHHNLASRQIDNVSTEKEIIENAMKAFKALDELRQQKINELQSKVTELTPKAEFYDAVTGSSDCIEMKEVAKLLNIKDVGRNKLFEILRNKKVLDRNNQPYQKFVDAGLFRVVESKYCVNGDVRINLKTVVFQKGIDFIKKVVTENNF